MGKGGSNISALVFFRGYVYNNINNPVYMEV